MSRIPSVRPWRVRFHQMDGSIKETVIETINKHFARWIANERLGFPSRSSKKVTVSLAKKSTNTRGRR
jgi:hypothetical protein